MPALTTSYSGIDKCHTSKCPSLSFYGCGFMAVYHVGVSSCLSQWAPHLLENQLAGSSSGALHALGLIAGISFEVMVRKTLKFAAFFREHGLARMLSPTFDMATMFRRSLDQVLPEDIHIRVRDRLHVSITQIWGWSNVRVSEFASREDLIETIMATSFVPFLFGWMPLRLNGSLYLDGALSGNLPVLDSNTITVSPFTGNTSICPEEDEYDIIISNTRIPIEPINTVNFNLENIVKSLMFIFLPPSTCEMEAMCRQGYRDALRFLMASGHIKCSKCKDMANTGPEDMARYMADKEPEEMEDLADKRPEDLEEMADKEPEDMAGHMTDKDPEKMEDLADKETEDMADKGPQDLEDLADKETEDIAGHMADKEPEDLEARPASCVGCQSRRKEAMVSRLADNIRAQFRENSCEQEGETGCDIQ